MPRNNQHTTSSGTTVYHTTRQKGRYRRENGVGTYSRTNKRRKAERYDRPYLDGNYDTRLLP